MKNKYENFEDKRMNIFNELVKRYWKGSLKNANDLDELAKDVMIKLNFGIEDLAFIKDHIRIAMGLNPNNSTVFEDELRTIAKVKINKPVVAKVQGPCKFCNSEACQCIIHKKYETSKYHRTRKIEIQNDKCIDCGMCVDGCNFGALADKIEFIPIINLLKDSSTKVFVSVAPAIAAQFGENVTMGKLRTAFIMMGFEDMLETAMFADILTIKEAFEFNHLVKTEEDFFLTSCCCPIWFNTIKNNYKDIYNHLSPSVSPMIASGRIIKRLYEDSKVVFIAPCIAKKSEAKEVGLEGAIDYVLNFRELKEIFDALDINLSELREYDKDQASFAGRIYARTGGVSFSVKTVVNRIDPDRVVKLKAKKVDGIKECRKVLDMLNINKNIAANFVEGMGCPGGCVGGPKTNVDAVTATKRVNDFGEDSFILTPLDNLNVMKILEQFGLDSIDKITDHAEIKNLLSR